MAIDETELNAFMGNFVHDLGAVMHAAAIAVGVKLGLYKALADGPITAEALALKTDTDPRYVREWLASQAASGYVTYEPTTQRFSMGEIVIRGGFTRFRRATETPFNLNL